MRRRVGGGGWEAGRGDVRDGAVHGHGGDLLRDGHPPEALSDQAGAYAYGRHVRVSQY